MSSHDSDSSSESFDPLNAENVNEEGWEDVEPDYEPQNVVDLFSDEVFDDVQSMLKHCKETYGFDLIQIRKELGLDFISTVKLVNFLRSETKSGRIHSSISSDEAFKDDKYLKPVLEDDPLLYNLDDLDTAFGPAEANASANQVEELRQQLQDLQAQFQDYREQVQKSLQDQLVDGNRSIPEKSDAPSEESPAVGKRSRDHEAQETGYFDSYSYNLIHEIMLKDTVRTDAYRDFIYDNKHLFKDKVVLDVGCGTGILSMFCAKAGAKLVVAVDNSGIIEKAKKNVAENELDGVVQCLRGKIEEVKLPVEKVDIIVSEWMGYALLYEAMFDSIIWARDHYLVPDGLLVPSHTSLFIAPLADPDLIASHVNFWHEVYGFKMTSMLANVCNEVLIKSTEPSGVAGPAAAFLELDLHTTKVEDLSFRKPFSATVKTDIDPLDGWVIWFDMFFMPGRNHSVPRGSTATDMAKKGFVAFTTGPDAPQTHWQQAILVINQDKAQGQSVKKEQTINGMKGPYFMDNKVGV